MKRKKASLYSYSEDDVPPSTDTRWPRWADLLSTRMTIPKTATELSRDCEEFSYAMLSNVLCWMDLRGLVLKKRVGKRLFWSLTPPPIEMELPGNCPTCEGQWADGPTGTICVKCGRSAEKAMRPKTAGTAE